MILFFSLGMLHPLFFTSLYANPKKAPFMHPPVFEKQVIFFEPTVSLRNGNFFRVFLDLYYDGEDDFRIERTYYSQSVSSGLFGRGWASELDTYLEPLGDGGLIVHEGGANAENPFYPLSYNAAQVHATIEQIMSIGKKENMYSTEKQKKEYQEKLLDNPDFRRSASHRLLHKKNQMPMAEGTIFRSLKMPYQMIKKTQTGYVRMDTSLNKEESFNAQGVLEKMSLPQKKYERFYLRAASGKLEGIQDSSGRKIHIKLNNKGSIVAIEEESMRGAVSEKSKNATYEYDSEGNLIEATNCIGDTYFYKYDTEGHHPLVKITYPHTKKTLEMTYYGKEHALFSGFLKSIKNLDGQRISFEYAGKVEMPGNFIVTVKKYRPSENQVWSEEKFSYFFVLKADRELLLSRQEVLEMDHHHHLVKKREFFVNPACEKTEKVVENEKLLLDLRFDAKCRVVYREDATEMVFIAYDAKTGKKLKVVQKQKNAPQAWQVQYDFGWDAIGKPLFGKKTFFKNKKQLRTQEVKLSYYRNGALFGMATQEHKLTFKNDDENRFTQMSLFDLKNPHRKPDVIEIAYRNDGSMKPLSEIYGGKKQQTVAQKMVDDIINKFQAFSAVMDTAYADFGRP